MFRVIYRNFDEINKTSREFVYMKWDVQNNKFSWKLANGEMGTVRHNYDYFSLCQIIESSLFDDELIDECFAEGDFYEFYFDSLTQHVEQKGFIYGLEEHNRLVNTLKCELDECISDIKLGKRTRESYFTIECKDCGCKLSDINKENIYTWVCPACGHKTIDGLLRYWTIDAEIDEEMRRKKD